MYSSLTIACWLCARPLPSGQTGPGAVSSQYIPCVAAKADAVIVVPATAQTLPITWYEKQTACDNYKRKRRIKLNALVRFIVLKVPNGLHDHR